jgi:hypothetical protein
MSVLPAPLQKVTKSVLYYRRTGAQDLISVTTKKGTIRRDLRAQKSTTKLR